ncbi:lipase 2 [Phlyctema vagabunda]|uniref:Lipase 2 n=1 Tax=Phlyctema vagabunda TaxID=108571 RepID=A0ABR4P1L9_9HELO
MTPEERLSLAELDPEFKLFIQQNPPPPPPVPEIGFFRRMGEARLAEIVSTLGPAPEEVTEKEVQIPTRDGSVINAWVVSPRSIPASGAPIVVWFHGGGFCIGDGREELSTARSFAIHAAVVTICVSYRLAPEHKFPTAIHDGQDALEWVIKSRDSLQVNLQLGFVVGGVSAGANIAAVLAHMARDLGLSPPLTGQILSVPPLLPESEVEEKHRNRLLSSTQEMGEGFLSPEVIKLFNGQIILPL